ncbi:MAG: ABC transporter permease subunit [Ruminococcus sp.]|jgi:ABC-2 type transport system permease protein|nr:ABC transporter permease subunit [Ruminococcus sp.]
MNGFSPFLKKEFFELYRKGRLLLFGILFVFFGILAPATAKLTPALFKMMSGELEQQGIIIKDITSTAASSYEQFFSNLSIILIVFVVVFAGSVTSEFSSGSVIPLLTKGLSRKAMMLSKLISALITWSAGYWLCFGITYGYTAYYWKDDSVQSVIPAVLLWWLFSVMVICLMFFFSSFVRTHVQVMIGTGCVVFSFKLMSIVKTADKYLPSALTNSMNICTGKTSVADIIPAIIIAGTVCAGAGVLGVVLIGRRRV